MHFSLGMPLQTKTDCGSETTGTYAFGNLLRYVLTGCYFSYSYRSCREYFAPNIDREDVPAHRFLRSVHNIVIERGWLRLRSVWGDNVYLEFIKGVEDGTYNEDDPVH